MSQGPIQDRSMFSYTCPRAQSKIGQCPKPCLKILTKTIYYRHRTSLSLKFTFDNIYCSLLGLILLTFQPMKKSASGVASDLQCYQTGSMPQRKNACTTLEKPGRRKVSFVKNKSSNFL